MKYCKRENIHLFDICQLMVTLNFQGSRCVFLAHLSICSGWVFVFALCPSSSIRPSGICSNCSNNISSETTGLLSSKLCLKHQCTGGTNNWHKLLARVIPLVAMATSYQILKILLQHLYLDSNFFLHKNDCQCTVFK